MPTELVPVLLDSLQRAGERRGHGCKLHVAEGERERGAGGLLHYQLSRCAALRATWRSRWRRLLTDDQLGHEWEWEETPEVTLKMVQNVDEAVTLFNRYSPQFIASLVTEDPARWEHFYHTINAPFTGNGFTRWVDGQYALCRPELGLSNWEYGRLFARGGILAATASSPSAPACGRTIRMCTGSHQ